MNNMPMPEISKQDSPSGESLNTPSHNEELFKKPMLINPDGDDSSKVAIVAPSKGIKVVATAKGFYNQNRYNIGDEFFIKSEENFGEWMKCVDYHMEKKRIEFYKNKKAQAKK